MSKSINTEYQSVVRVCAYKAMKFSKSPKHTFHHLPFFQKEAQQGMEDCLIGVVADSPVQHKERVFPRSSNVGSVELRFVVVSHRLQQRPQLGVVLSPLGTVDCAPHHAAIGIWLVAELPGDVVFLACSVLEEAERGRGVPGVVRVPLQSIQAQDQVQTGTVSEVVQFV